MKVCLGKKEMAGPGIDETAMNTFLMANPIDAAEVMHGIFLVYFYIIRCSHHWKLYTDQAEKQ
jgi:hypothetical protein